ncbi:4'-phosphopantetheinyl transferase family protein [[Pantoea] beijingensis]|nr:4'-phosphopantetheinyl transferase superfamily protein [[Pantoea] beijingensis]
MFARLCPMTPVETDFITALCCGDLPQLQQSKIAEIRFSLSNFHEKLFSDYAITVPTHLQKAVKKRRAEYLASRYATRRLLETCGITDFLLKNDSDRVPIWPKGVIGSLSHCYQRAVIVTTQRTKTLIGVDVEHVMTPATAENIYQSILSPNEHKRLIESGLSFAAALTLIFSFKESLYKALFPGLRQFIDFHSAEVIAIDQYNNEAILRLTHSLHQDFPAGRCFHGYFLHDNDEITTLIIDN